MPDTPMPPPGRRVWPRVLLALSVGFAAAPGAADAAPEDQTVRALRRICEGELAAMAGAQV